VALSVRFAAMTDPKTTEEELVDHLEAAWVVIANATDWDLGIRETWVRAANKWRDEYHRLLSEALARAERKG